VRRPARLSSFPPYNLNVARTCSYTARSSTRHIAVRQQVSAARQNASRSLSRRSHRAPAQILAHGLWMSCRSAKWEVGHRTERTCGSRGAISGLSPDLELVYDTSLALMITRGSSMGICANPVCDPASTGTFFWCHYYKTRIRDSTCRRKANKMTRVSLTVGRWCVLK
jgi:hypothetical protein